MPIQIHITLDGADTLETVLRRAGLLLVARAPAPIDMPGPVGGFPDAVLLSPGAAAPPGPEPVPLALVVDNAAPVQPATTDTAAAEQAEKRKRRTKAEMEAARAAEAEAAAVPVTTYVVSRFDGSTDLENTDSGVAADRLCELIAGSGEEGALAALLKANAGLGAILPSERNAAINEAVAAARASWAAPAPVVAAPVVAAAASAYPLKDADGKIPARAPDGTVLDTAGFPLTAVSADRQGAQNCIRVLASTAAGFASARALLDKHGVERLSALTPDDAKHALVAAEAAAALGLPMAQQAGALI